jgi:hypothetical protein
MTAGSYARALEEALSRLRERPTVLSPRDWSLVSDWYSREIPLGLVLEVLSDAGERARKRRRPPPRSLAYIAAAVGETWQLVLEGRRVPEVERPDALPSIARSRERWARSAQRSGGELGRSIDGLIRRLDRGLDPRDADKELDTLLLDVAPADLLSRVSGEIDDELRAFRQRMTPEVFDLTRRRARMDRLRRELDLPRLALGEPTPEVE